MMADGFDGLKATLVWNWLAILKRWTALNHALPASSERRNPRFHWFETPI